MKGKLKNEALRVRPLCILLFFYLIYTANRSLYILKAGIIVWFHLIRETGNQINRVSG